MNKHEKWSWVLVGVLVLGSTVLPDDASAGHGLRAFGSLSISSALLFCGGVLGLALAGRPKQKEMIEVQSTEVQD